MRYFLLVLVCIFAFRPLAGAQDAREVITDADWNAVIVLLQAEDWKASEKMCKSYLKRFKGAEADTFVQAAVVRYMYVVSVGGMVGEKMIGKEAGLKKLKGFEGKMVITPFRSFKKGGMFNHFDLNEKGDAWRCCVANDQATTIYIFEDYQMDDPDLLFGVGKIEGRRYRLAGAIGSIGVGGFAMPRLEIDYEEVFVFEED